MSLRVQPISHVIWTMAIAILLILGSSGCTRRTEAPPERPIAVRVATVRHTELAEAIEYLGTVHAVHEVPINARIQGTVVQIPRNEGEVVIAGDILVRLSAPHLDSALERLRADDNYWSLRLDEDLRLAENGSIPLEQVKSSRRSAKVARAALSEAETMLTWATERSPFEGVILEWRAEPGQHVMPGQPLLLIGDNDFEFHVPVLEEDLRRGIRRHTPAMIEMYDGQVLMSEVTEVGAIAMTMTRSFSVTVSVPAGHEAGFRIGESIPVRFLLSESESVATVPAYALAGGEADPHVFLIEDGRARRWTVEPGIAEKGRVAIAPTLPPTAQVAVSNLDELEDGVAVFSVPDAGEEQ